MDYEEKLIYLVQMHECLYNIKSRYYSDKNVKNNAWQKVGAEMNMPADDCQKAWKKIRDGYRKSLLLRESRSGSARKIERPLKFEKELEFIKPFMKGRQQISNLTSSPEDSDIATDGELQPMSPRPQSQLSLSLQPQPQLSPSPRSQPQLSRSLRTQPQLSPSPRQQSRLSRSPRRLQSRLSSETSSSNEQPMSNLLFKQYVEAKRVEDDPIMSFFITMGRTVRTMPTNVQAKLKGDIFRLVNEEEIKLADVTDSMTSSEYRRRDLAEYNILADDTDSMITSEYRRRNQAEYNILIADDTDSMTSSEYRRRDPEYDNIAAIGNSNETTMPSSSNYRLETTSIRPSTSVTYIYNETINVPTTSQTSIRPSTSVPENYNETNVPTTSFSYTQSIIPFTSRKYQKTTAENSYETNSPLPTYTKDSGSTSFVAQSPPPSPYVPYPVSSKNRLETTSIRPSTSLPENYNETNVPTTSFSYTQSIIPFTSRKYQKTTAENSYETNSPLPTYTKDSGSTSFVAQSPPPSPYVPYPVSKSQKKALRKEEYEANTEFHY